MVWLKLGDVLRWIFECSFFVLWVMWKRFWRVGGLRTEDCGLRSEDWGLKTQIWGLRTENWGISIVWGLEEWSGWHSLLRWQETRGRWEVTGYNGYRGHDGVLIPGACPIFYLGVHLSGQESGAFCRRGQGFLPGWPEVSTCVARGFYLCGQVPSTRVVRGLLLYEDDLGSPQLFQASVTVRH